MSDISLDEDIDPNEDEDATVTLDLLRLRQKQIKLTLEVVLEILHQSEMLLVTIANPTDRARIILDIDRLKRDFNRGTDDLEETRHKIAEIKKSLKRD